MITAFRQHRETVCVALSFEIMSFYLILGSSCQSSLPRNYSIHLPHRVKHIMFQFTMLDTTVECFSVKLHALVATWNREIPLQQFTTLNNNYKSAYSRARTAEGADFWMNRMMITKAMCVHCRFLFFFVLGSTVYTRKSTCRNVLHVWNSHSSEAGIKTLI